MSLPKQTRVSRRGGRAKPRAHERDWLTRMADEIREGTPGDNSLQTEAMRRHGGAHCQSGHVAPVRPAHVTDVVDVSDALRMMSSPRTCQQRKEPPTPTKCQKATSQPRLARVFERNKGTDRRPLTALSQGGGRYLVGQRHCTAHDIIEIASAPVTLVQPAEQRAIPGAAAVIGLKHRIAQLDEGCKRKAGANTAVSYKCLQDGPGGKAGGGRLGSPANRRVSATAVGAPRIRRLTRCWHDDTYIAGPQWVNTNSGGRTPALFLAVAGG